MFRTNSIRGKFIITVFAICLSCLIVVSVISFRLSYNQVKSQINQSANEKVEKKALELNNWFEEQGQVVINLAHDIEIKDDYSDEYLTNYLLKKLERQNEQVLDYYIGFADTGRTMVSGTSWVPPSDYDATTRNWYMEAVKQNKLVYITPYLDADSGQMVITLANPIKNGDSLVGVIAADILLDEVIKIAYDARIKEANYVVLLDKSNHFLIHPHPIFLPTADRAVNANLVMQGRFRPLIEEIENNRYHMIELKDYDHVTRCFVLSNIGATDWTFGVAIPRSEYIKPLNNLLVGFGAALAISLLLGIIITLPLTRSLLKPVLELNEAVSRFAHKDFTARSPVSSQDEVGKLSENFNQMADIIQAYNQDLEETVAQRTAEVRNLLNNAGQGFLSFGMDLIIAREYSTECKRIFEQEVGGLKFTDLVFPDDEAERSFMENALRSIMQDDDELRREVYFSLLPTELVINKGIIALDYKLLPNSALASVNRFMIILTDISEQRQLEQDMEKERKLLRMVVKIVVHSNDFKEYINDFRQFAKDIALTLLDDERPPEVLFANIFRKLHTFKGGFAQLEMENLVVKLHECETELAAHQDEFGQMSTIQKNEFLTSLNLLGGLEQDLALMQDVLGEQFLEQDNMLVIDEAKLLKTYQKALQTLSPWESKLLLPELRQLMYKPFKELFKVYPDTVARLAARLGKSPTVLHIMGGDLLVDTEYYREFAKTLIHVFRNAVDHGIETAAERIALGKAELATISCEIAHDDTGIYIMIADDGRGIDGEKLKEQAKLKGFCDAQTIDGFCAAEVLELIFADNVSLCEEITIISGRGVGLAAVKEELDKLGGSVQVSSQLGEGTRFTFYLPLADNNKIQDTSAGDMIKPLLNTMQGYFSNNLDEELLHCSETKNINRLQLYKISAIANIKGIIRSTFILSVDEELGKQMVHKMLMEEVEAGMEGAYMEDVLAECANIILGNSLRYFADIQELVMFEPAVTLSSERTAIKYINTSIWTSDMLFTSGKASMSLILQDKL